MTDRTTTSTLLEAARAAASAARAGRADLLEIGLRVLADAGDIPPESLSEAEVDALNDCGEALDGWVVSPDRRLVQGGEGIPVVDGPPWKGGS